MKKYLPGAIVAVAMVGGVYGILLIAATAAPAPSVSSHISQSSVVADQLRADATRLTLPDPRPSEDP